MENNSNKIDKILSNTNINWDDIIDSAVETPLTNLQKRDVRNLMIATAKIAALISAEIAKD